MPKGWVFDSSSLIILGKIGALDTLKHLPGRVVVPEGVSLELADGKATDGAKRWIQGEKVKVVAVAINPVVASWDLGQGESEVISYSKLHAGYIAVLDDKLARNCANGFAVSVMGTIGLLLWMKKAGKLKAVRPYLEMIAKTDFWISESLLVEALRLAGEKQ